MAIDNGIIPGYDPERDAGEYHFDIERANDVCDFFSECLTHVKGELAGQPFILEPWERAAVRAMFGWVDNHGNRRYRYVFIYVPRKNGKSTLCAGIANYILFCDDEPGAEIYSAAAESKQAAIVFNMAKDMVGAEPELDGRCRCYLRSIVEHETGGTYMPISSDAHSKHGYNIHAAIVDELHAHPNGDLMDVLETSTGSRSQPLIIILTTADWARPESPCNEKLEYALKVRDGELSDPRFLPVIYAADQEDDWTDIEVWKRSNPCYGVSLKPEIVQEDFDKAVGNPRKESIFKRLHLNMQTKLETRWLLDETWMDCAIEEYDIPDGTTCIAGLDLAATTDINALVLLFPELDDLIVPYFWVPEDHPENHRRGSGGRYRAWIEAGMMETTPGSVTDYAYIRQRIVELSKRWPSIEIAIDPWNARYLSTQLSEDDGIPVVEFRQGYASMNEPTKELERRLMQKKMAHFGHPVLRWMMSNAMVKTDPAGNIKVDKEKSVDKVDGVIGLIMALGRSMIYEKPQKSAYEDRGILFV